MNTVDATELGFAPDRLSHLTAVIKADIAHEQYDGAVVMIARSGTVVLQEALGFAERATRRTICQDDVFHLFSVTKALTTVAVLQCIDRGELSLTHRVVTSFPNLAVEGNSV